MLCSGLSILPNRLKKTYGDKVDRPGVQVIHCCIVNLGSAWNI